jgi:prevent-host-death family protein
VANKNTIMTKSISALNARTHFGEILERIERCQERFLVYRKGAPKAVILSIRDFLENIVEDPDLFLKAHQKAKTVGLDELTMAEINQEVAEVRAQLRKKKK